MASRRDGSYGSLYRPAQLRPTNLAFGIFSTPSDQDIQSMTTIGTSLVITGEVTSKEDITIHGQIKGQVSMTEGSLMVAPTARLEADVTVPTITVHGTISGNVSAAERVELTPTATVKGTLVAPAVVLREGATFNGKIQVERKGATRSTPKVN